MEVGLWKRMVVLTMMVALVVARGEEISGDPFRDSGRRVDGGIGICIPQCALGCVLRLSWNPIAYGFCFSLCMIDCKFSPSDSVYGCTTSCAYSHKVSPLPITDRSSAVSYVKRCYENCKKE